MGRDSPSHPTKPPGLARPPSVPHTHNLGVINVVATNEVNMICNTELTYTTV